MICRWCRRPVVPVTMTGVDVWVHAGTEHRKCDLHSVRPELIGKTAAPVEDRCDHESGYHSNPHKGCVLR